MKRFLRLGPTALKNGGGFALKEKIQIEFGGAELGSESLVEALQGYVRQHVRRASPFARTPWLKIGQPRQKP
jgi:hypothetical protein